MKKNFKKSKFVILPALATLVLTSVATVTGTAAWFSANRAVTVSGSKFETKVLDGNLKVAITKGVGIAEDVTAGTEVSATVDGCLTHGSYNAAAGSAGSLYVANLDDAGNTEDYSDRGNVSDAVMMETKRTTFSDWFAGKTGDKNNQKNIWYGVSWTMKFTTETTNQTSVALQFDPANSTISQDNEGGETIKGLRIAFMTNNKLVVASGDKAEPEPSTSLKHVTSTTQTGNFDTGIFYKIGDKTVGVAKDYADDMISRDTYLGDVGVGGLDVTVVAWFEGEDPSIVNDNVNKLSSVATSLQFYARRYTKA